LNSSILLASDSMGRSLSYFPMSLQPVKVLSPPKRMDFLWWLKIFVRMSLQNPKDSASISKMLLEMF
jgi:hypothetical protein